MLASLLQASAGLTHDIGTGVQLDVFQLVGAVIGLLVGLIVLLTLLGGRSHWR